MILNYTRYDMSIRYISNSVVYLHVLLGPVPINSSVAFGCLTWERIMKKALYRLCFTSWLLTDRINQNSPVVRRHVVVSEQLAQNCLQYTRIFFWLLKRAFSFANEYVLFSSAWEPVGNAPHPSNRTQFFFQIFNILSQYFHNSVVFGDGVKFGEFEF